MILYYSRGNSYADSHGNYLDGLSGPNYSSQNLYVQPPTRSSHSTHQHNLVEDKSNLVPRGRSRGPLLDVSLSQLDRPATPVGLPHHHAHSHSCPRSGLEDGTPSLGPPDPLGSPPRPPPPRPEGEHALSVFAWHLNLITSQHTAAYRYFSWCQIKSQKTGIVFMRLVNC
jgi:hypothetical protein